MSFFCLYFGTERVLYLVLLNYLTKNFSLTDIVRSSPPLLVTMDHKKIKISISYPIFLCAPVLTTLLVVNMLLHTIFGLCSSFKFR